ncbi:hypothetical protein [Nocardioides sp. LHG3406-4]|uniref:hypothetical protein n=1 Tax=Nocardioides sp. LHG3406-4 TaxID=2804575 RepID=UPI003CE8FC81
MTGKRGGSRRAERPARAFRPAVLVHSLAITLLVVAWGYLVYVAIDFGGSARAGERSAWWLLGLASLGAVACLFAGLMLVSRLQRVLGWSRADKVDDEHAAPRPPGGRRAAR